MRIFISYRRFEDNKSYIVGTIHEKLAAVFGSDQIFRDTYDIAGGTDWRLTLERELNACTVMLVVIGPDWANLAYPNGEKRLFDPQDVTRWEIETGLRRYRDGNISVIPVLVTGATVPTARELPETLRELLKIQGINLRNFPDFDRDLDLLIRDIKKSQGYHPVEDTEYFEPKTVYIAEGPFLMGSRPGQGIPDHEQPQHEVDLPAFCIGTHPITNYEYSLFISETGTAVSPILGWDGQRFPEELTNRPVAGITWYEALAYCRWLSKKAGRNYSLPTEAQWEKACRGGNTSIFPWGSEFDPQRCNYGQPEIAPVDKYPPQNEFGCFDLVGNVRQWTCTLWGDRRSAPDPKYLYPWKDDGRNNLEAANIIRRVFRGGVISDSLNGLTCSARSSNAPDNAGAPGKRMGFRVALGAL